LGTRPHWTPMRPRPVDHLIRSDLRGCPLSALRPLTCQNSARRCAATDGVERCCPAKIRPVKDRCTGGTSRRLSVKPQLTVNGHEPAWASVLVPLATPGLCSYAGTMIRV
jgi:hypothetical protein